MSLARYERGWTGSMLDVWAEDAQSEIDRLTRELAECFNLGGSDADGNGDDWRAANAVRSVRQLRADYDEACDEGEKLRARIAELEDLAEKLRLANAEWRPLVESREAQIDRLRAEVEALRADADTTIRVVWQAAITAANNICVQRSDRWNDEDGPCERIAESSECAKAIRGWIEPVAHMHELRELVDADIAARKGEGSEG